MGELRRYSVFLWLFLALPLSAANPPALLSISPQTVIAGTSGFTLTANGANFVSGSTVQFNGTPRTTTFVSASQLTATISSSDIINAGTPQITATNPGTAPSSPLTLTILPNNPTISSLSPSTLPAGTSSLTVTVNGQNFASTASIQVNGASRTTAFVDSSHLTLTLRSTDVASPATLNVAVLNPNNRLSNTVPLTVTSAATAPTITLLNPNSVVAGSPAFTLSIVGSNFVGGSSVRVNGTARNTTFVDATHLTAQITSNDIVTAGTLAITILNPDGTVSAPANLTVTATAVPVINSISPTTVIVGAAPFTLSISGTNFVSGSTVQVGPVSRAATFVNSTSLTVTIATSDVTTVGQVPITVTTPLPKSAVSNQAILYVVSTNAPSITSISPQTVQAGSTGFNMLVNGSNFLLDDIVQLAGSSRTTQFLSATQLAAAIPASDIATTGTQPITVARHDGSAVSAPVMLTIADTAGPSITTFTPSSANVGDPAFTLVINGNNFTPTSVVLFDNTVRTTQYVSATELHINVAATDLGSARGVPVQVVNDNGTTSPVLLFQVVAPVPAITALSPASVISGDVGFTLTVAGNNFSADSVININGSPRQTQLVSSTGSLTTNIAAADISAPGSLVVTVTRAGSTSAAVSLPVLQPTITAVNPPVIVLGSPTISLNVQGSAFLTTSTVIFAGSAQPTTFNANASLTVTLSGTILSSPGQYALSVRNSANSLSAPFLIEVQSPGSPRIDSIQPSSIAVGSGVLSIQLTGANFVPLSVVTINGADRATTFVAANVLTVALLSSDASAAGTLHVAVRNPDGTVSAEALLTVTGPPPQAPVRRRVVPH